MQRRLIVPLLFALVLASAPAHASNSQRSIYAGVLTVLSALVIGCLTSGIALYVAAPNASTLMTYKREVSASDDLLTGGAIAAVPTLIFAAIGGRLFSLGKDTTPQVSLAPSSSGATVGLTVSF